MPAKPLNVESCPGPRGGLRWPLPALGAWLLAWVCYRVLLYFELPWPAAWATACVLGAACARAANTPWRRACVGAGFPLSWALMGQWPGHSPMDAAWWLLPLAVLCSLYPLNAWRDAPLFPTPLNALQGLGDQAPLPTGAKVVDAGCGLGAGLRALSTQYPQAQLSGWEWSRPLAWLCAWRCSGVAAVLRADIWRQDWSAFQLVYLFQRPETMPRAVRKAQAELRTGAYLVSLEFEAPGLTPLARLETVPGKPVWVYRMAGPASLRP